MKENEGTRKNPVVQFFNFNGGPYDGCRLVFHGDKFISDVFFASPLGFNKDFDTYDKSSVHEYTIVSTSRVEGSNANYHRMEHIKNTVVSCSKLKTAFDK